MSLLPAGVSKRSFDRALKEFADIVGSEWVSTQEEDRALYVDAYSPDSDGGTMASGFVAPNSTEQVQACVRVANKYKIPIWPMSAGRNLAYGGAAPKTNDTFVLDLKRMNRILEVNDELAYAVVEPGVSFLDLYRHLKENGHKLWMSVPGPGWGSIIGNALERGAGYGKDSDHFATSVGMEVVLPDGDLLRTGMGAMEKNPSWHISSTGFGPSVDGLFSQSNFGIVTQMGRFLTPEPEGVLGCELSAEDEDAAPLLMDVLRPFKIDGTISTPVVLGNQLLIAAYTGNRSKWYDGPGAIPDDVLKDMQKKLGIGWWSGFFGIYGPEEEVKSKWKRIEAALNKVPGVSTESRFYGKGEEITHQRDSSLAGIPHLEEFNSLNWASNGAHIDFSPVVPMLGSELEKTYRLVKDTLTEFGVDYRGAIYAEGRFFRQVVTLIFNRNDPEDQQRVRNAFSTAVNRLAAEGYGEYRTHLAYMDDVAKTYNFNDNAMLRFHERLKKAIDPRGIIAPGKSGIWGSYKKRDV